MGTPKGTPKGTLSIWGPLKGALGLGAPKGTPLFFPPPPPPKSPSLCVHPMGSPPRPPPPPITFSAIQVSLWGRESGGLWGGLGGLGATMGSGGF